MNWLLFAAEQLTRPYTFAEQHGPRIIGYGECPICKKKFPLKEKHKKQKFCSVFCGRLQSNIRKNEKRRAEKV